MLNDRKKNEAVGSLLEKIGLIKNGDKTISETDKTKINKNKHKIYALNYSRN